MGKPSTPTKRIPVPNWLMALPAFVAIFFFSCQDKTPEPTKPPKSEHTVTLDEARNQIRQHRSFRASNANVPAIDTALFYRSESFSKTDLQAILAEDSCDGIRIYPALNKDGRIVLLIVGRNGRKDLLPTPPRDSSYNRPIYYILRSEVPCPEVCPEGASLEEDGSNTGKP
jgi:hypothetical protein